MEGKGNLSLSYLRGPTCNQNIVHRRVKDVWSGKKRLLLEGMWENQKMNDKLISFLRRREEGNPKQISFFYILRFNCVRYFGLRMYKPSSGGLAEKDHSRSRSSKAQMYSDYKNCVCYIAGWKFLLNSAPSHWLLRSHSTSINETVSRQNLCKICDVRG